MNMARTINGFPLTGEQNTAVEAALTGDNLKISARAGAGKTSTLKAIAEAMPDRKGLYIAFNKLIADEADREFPRAVMCKTAHSLAYRVKGVPFQKAGRLKGKLNGRLVAEKLGLTDTGIFSAAALGYFLIGFVNRFCHSADDELKLDHAPWGDFKVKVQEGEDFKAVRRKFFSDLLPYAVRLWSCLIRDDGDLPITHDVYLKLWALDKPALRFDYILVDEAQDLNGVLLGLLKHQQAQIIYVGDHYQQIYSWRGAVNAMAQVQGVAECEITQSFRFGSSIANAAVEVLKHQLGESVVVRGFDKVSSRLAMINSPDAILCRTNREVIAQLIKWLPTNRRIAVCGGVGELLMLLYGVSDLMQGKKTDVAELAGFQDWDEVLEHSKTEAGQEFAVLVGLVQKYSVSHLIRVLNEVKYNREFDADLVISTGHKSKGREWDSVVLAEDFKSPEEKGWTNEDANLLYVAVTRAKLLLDVSGCPAALMALGGVCEEAA